MGKNSENEKEIEKNVKKIQKSWKNFLTSRKQHDIIAKLFVKNFFNFFSKFSTSQKIKAEKEGFEPSRRY